MSNDDLDRLRVALKAAPAAGPSRAEAMARAMEKFDDLHGASQGKPRGLRPNPDRPKGAGLLDGVRLMLDRLTSRAGLAATASIAALGFGLFLVAQDARPPQIAKPPRMETAPPLVVTGTGAPDMMPPPQAAETAMPAPMAAGRTSSGAVAKRAPASPAMRAQDALVPIPQARDQFANADPNPLKVTAQAPVSTFSVDVDTASWSWVRASIRAGVLPAADAVRVEEMLNYFPYTYPAPEPGAAPFRAQIATFATPWNPGTHLVRIGLQGRLPALADRPAVNLVFLIDTSGSMQGPDRLGLLKSGFTMLLGELRREDKVAIVAYAGSAGEVLAPTPASDRGAILAALDGLQAGGSTAGGAGLEAAYRLAERMGGKGSVNRVVLATDGDFNVGPSDPDALADYVASKRSTGVYLSVLGFGRGNLNDALMQALAQNGNGQAAYIDSAEEARKVLVDQAAGALFPIAQDVKIQVEWNPATVAEYRLIGYETRALAREDFANDNVDAGDIGAGHQVTALYEITPAGSPARLTDPLRYAPPPVTGTVTEFGWLRLRYKAPGEDVSALIETPIPAQLSDPDPDARFAAAIAGFGQVLSGGKYLGTWGFDQAIALALDAKGDDRFGYRAEAINLMRTAQTLSGR